MAARKKRARKKKSAGLNFHPWDLGHVEKHTSKPSSHPWDLGHVSSFTTASAPGKKKRKGRKSKGGFVRAKAVYVKA